ncbi:hypothetical protein ACX80W_05200 [Arthrobacter sp. TMN-37]
MSSGGADTSLLTRAWSALGEDPAALGRVPPGGEPALASALNVPRLARDSVAAASLAAAQWTDHLLPRHSPRSVRLDAGRIATAFTSERHLRIRGEAPDLWAPLSGFFQAADGWVRTHANYPHHLGRLLAALELAPAPGRRNSPPGSQPPAHGTSRTGCTPRVGSPPPSGLLGRASPNGAAQRMRRR